MYWPEYGWESLVVEKEDWKCCRELIFVSAGADAAAAAAIR